LRLNHSYKKGVLWEAPTESIAAMIAIDHPEKFYHVLLLAQLWIRTKKNSGGLINMYTMDR